ncbi:nitrate- and nitrite sensing domain-containing protein, partial [Streptomyces sp. MBT62]|uniref:nitrate- and nitrite sensing domain-containing protein n=1 Tax=Streptomyces sp. MBT62 TaxID=2800410 RepID=UPI001909F9BF
MAMASAALTDVAGWLLLAGVIALAGPGGRSPAALLGLLACYLLAMLGVARPLLRRTSVARRLDDGPLALRPCWATSALKLHAVFGAFLPGLLMPRRPNGTPDPELVSWTERVGGLLLPVFFITTGWSVDIGGLGLDDVLLLLALIAVAVVAKLGGCTLAARLGGGTWRESTLIGALMNTRGLTELIALNVGKEAGLLDDRWYALLVIMAIATTAMTSPLPTWIRRPDRPMSSGEGPATSPDPHDVPQHPARADRPIPRSPKGTLPPRPPRGTRHGGMRHVRHRGSPDTGHFVVDEHGQRSTQGDDHPYAQCPPRLPVPPTRPPAPCADHRIDIWYPQGVPTRYVSESPDDPLNLDDRRGTAHRGCGMRRGPRREERDPTPPGNAHGSTTNLWSHSPGPRCESGATESPTRSNRSETGRHRGRTSFVTMRVWTSLRPLLGRLGAVGKGRFGRGSSGRLHGGRTTPGRRPLPGWRSIRGRVAVVITVPICLLLAVAGLAVDGRAEALGDARTTRAEVGLSLRVQALVHRLQRERGLTNGLLGGEEQFRTPLAGTRKRVDTALRGMRTDPAVEDVIQRHLRRLADIRAAADRGSADQAATLAFYTSAVDALNAVDPVAETATGADRQLRDGLAALQELAAAKESVALERGLLNGVFAEGAFHGRVYLDFTEVRATRVAALARFQQVATASQRAALRKAFATKDAERATVYESHADGAPDGSALRVDAGAWWDAMTVLVDDLYAVQQSVGDDVQDRANRLSHDAELGLAAYLAAAALMAAAVAGLAAFASRSLTRPLHALAEAAHDVARHRLPEAVARIQQSPEDQEKLLLPAEAPNDPAALLLGGAAEIAEVAASLRQVEHTALHLAAEQAGLRRNTTDSLANLGRRNQNLVRRQLGLITRLEKQELDPDALAELFELDHLATRMRRNAESLLVLAGQNPPRPTAAAAGGLEVVQAAVAEVEQYRRVLIAAVEPVRVHGHAVADVAHLLAELIENGLTFSPPTQPVEVHGWYDTEDDTYSFAVVDHGIGMSEADKERAGARFSVLGEETLLAAPTQFLGHLVVGRLTHRLGEGAQVHLFDTTGGGLSALLVLPGRLLAPAEDLSATPPPARPAVSALLNGFRAGVREGRGVRT